MPVVFKTTKIAGRAQSDPALYEILRDIGLAANDLAVTVNDNRGYLTPTGAIVMWPTASAPYGWLLCDGSAVSRLKVPTLFALIGTTYGAGDGSSTFNLPDMRQRFPLGKAASGTGSTLAGTGGAIDHVHAVDPPNTTSGGASAQVTVCAATPTINVSTRNHTHDVNIASFSSGAENPPFLAINFIIKT